MEEGTYDIPNDIKNVEDSYEIPLNMNNAEGTYEIPMNMHNVEGSYDILMNMKNGEAKVQVGTKQTCYMTKRRIILIFLILIIIFVGVCIGFYFAGKASAESRDIPNVDVTTTVSKVTPGSTEFINATRTSPKCTNITCSTPESTSRTSPTHASSICLDGWVKHGESCYFFGNDQYIGFSEAVSYCQRYNGKLIEVDSDSENQFVKNYLKLKGPHHYYLMGLTDVTTEGTFLLYSSKRPATFFDWANGEPNNGGESDTANEDCVFFVFGLQLQLG